jgi:putative DNA primase/helicase
MTPYNVRDNLDAAASDDGAAPAEHGVESSPEQILPSPGAPMDVARKLVVDRYTGPGEALTLRHWRGAWWKWQTAKWAEIEQRAVRAAAYAFTEKSVYQAGEDTKPWAPNRKKIGDLLEALAAIVLLPESVPMPAWLDGATYTGVVVSVANGLLDVARRELLPHNPRFFNAPASRSTSTPTRSTPNAGTGSSMTCGATTWPR